MSRERLQQVQEEEVVVDWSIVAVGGGIALFGLVAVAVIVWLVLTRPPAAEEPAVVAEAPHALPQREADGGPALPLILNQGSAERPREAGAWSVPVTETLPAPKKKGTPTPVVVVPVEPVKEPEKPAVVRQPVKVSPRALLSEAELIKQVEKVPALDLTNAATSKELIKQLAGGSRNKQYQEACDKVTELAKRSELGGLPRHVGTQLPSSEAAELARYSRLYRMVVADPEGWRKRHSGGSVSGFGLTDQDKNRLPIDTHHLDAGLRTLMQIIPAEDKELRRQFIGSLGQSSSDQVNVALANRALFEFDSSVRADAGKVLAERYGHASKFRQELLAGLRYPWPPIADHAADALLAANQNDDGLVPALIDMLDLPDPAAPFRNGDNKWVQAELVRINHLRNCLLCHAPFDGKSTQAVRGVIPDADQPLPVVYYDDPRGSFVRADITLLRQDFSIKLKVADHGKWPELQRYDYVVRQRELTEDEVKNLERERPSSSDYPQREAVLHVLRGLTGIDAGHDSDAWRQRLGKR